MWCYLFNLLKIVINIIIKPVTQTYTVHVKDTTREDKDCLAVSANSFYRDGEMKGQI